MCFFLSVSRAVEANISIVNEVGVDPGIDHMLAMECFDEVKQAGGKVGREFWLVLTNLVCFIILQLHCIFHVNLFLCWKPFEIDILCICTIIMSKCSFSWYQVFTLITIDVFIIIIILHTCMYYLYFHIIVLFLFCLKRNILLWLKICYCLFQAKYFFYISYCPHIFRSLHMCHTVEDYLPLNTQTLPFDTNSGKNKPSDTNSDKIPLRYKFR